MNKQRETIVSEKTLIPVSLLIACIAGLYWLFGVSFKASANEKEIKDLKEKITVLDSINTRLSNIEGKLSILVPDEKK